MICNVVLNAVGIPDRENKRRDLHSAGRDSVWCPSPFSSIPMQQTFEESLVLSHGW